MYNLNSNDIDPFWLEEKKSTIFRVKCSKTNYPQGAAMASMKKKKKLRVGCSCWKNRGSSYSFWVGVGPAQNPNAIHDKRGKSQIGRN